MSHTNTPPGIYQGLNALRLSGAFQIESDSDFVNIARTTSPLRDEIHPLRSGMHEPQVITSERDGEAPNKGKGLQTTAKFSMLQETSHLGRTLPTAMATENLPQEVRIPLTEEISARIRTAWDVQAT